MPQDPTSWALLVRRGYDHCAWEPLLFGCGRAALRGRHPCTAASNFQVLGGELPVRQLPEGLDVLGPRVAVVDVVGVLPDIAGQQGLVLGRQRGAGVAGRAQFESSARYLNEPGPAGAEQVDLDRSTLVGWVGGASRLLAPLVEALRALLRLSPLPLLDHLRPHPVRRQLGRDCFRSSVAVDIGSLTPAVVHFGEAPVLVAHRQPVLDAAHEAHPDRFVRRPPKPLPLPSAVWINKPVPPGEKTQEEGQ